MMETLRSLPAREVRKFCGEWSRERIGKKSKTGAAKIRPTAYTMELLTQSYG